MDINFELAEQKYAQNLLEFMSLVLQKQDLERMMPVDKLISEEGFYIPHHDPELVYKYHLHTVKLDDLFIKNVYQGTILQYYDYDMSNKMDLIFASDYNIALFVNLCMKDDREFMNMMRKLSIHEQDYLFNILKSKIKPQIYESLNKKLIELQSEVMKLDDVVKIKDDIDDMIFKKVKEYYSENLERAKGGSNYISFLKYDPKGTLAGKEGYYLNMQNFNLMIDEIDEMLKIKLNIEDRRYEDYITNNSLWFLKQAGKLKNRLSKQYVNVNGLPSHINDPQYLLYYLDILIKSTPISYSVNSQSMENDIMIRFCILICIIGHLCDNKITKFHDLRTYMKKYYADNLEIITSVSELIKNRLLKWMPITVEPYRRTYINMISVLNRMNLLSTDEEIISYPVNNFKFLSDILKFDTNLIFASNIAVVLLQQICSTDKFQLAELFLYGVIDSSKNQEIIQALSKNLSSYMDDDSFITKYTSLHTYHKKIVELTYDMISYNMSENIETKIEYFTERSIYHCIV
jgi:hypothetical protein